VLPADEQEPGRPLPPETPLPLGLPLPDRDWKVLPCETPWKSLSLSWDAPIARAQAWWMPIEEGFQPGEAYQEFRFVSTMEWRKTRVPSHL
jgi:hypothetical protein